MFGPLTKRASASRRRLPAVAASGLAAAGLSVGVLMSASPALAADSHPAGPAHPAPAPHGDKNGPAPKADHGVQAPSSGPGVQSSSTDRAGSSGSTPTAGPATAGPATAGPADAGPAGKTDKGAQADPGAKPPKPGKDGSAGPASDPKGGPAKGAQTPPPPKDPKTPPPTKGGKGPKGSPTTAATGCSEDSFLGSASPASGSTVALGSRISATYSDEKVISATQPPSLTLSGPGGDMNLQIDHFVQAKTVLLTAQLPTTGLVSGTYVATLKAWDGDQNKAGGDCGVASWSFVVTGPNPTPPVNPPVNPGPPVNPAPPATPPATPVNPPAAPVPPTSPSPVPTQVLGVTLTPPASPAPAAAQPLAFTGDATRVMTEAGLLLVAAGSAMIGRSQRRRFSRSRKR